jgi:hypothetical protein
MNIDLGNTKLGVPSSRWYDSRAYYPASNYIVLIVMSVKLLCRSHFWGAKRAFWCKLPYLTAENPNPVVSAKVKVEKRCSTCG